MQLNQFPFGLVAALLTQGKVVPFLGAAASSVGVGDPAQLPWGVPTQAIRKTSLLRSRNTTKGRFSTVQGSTISCVIASTSGRSTPHYLRLAQLLASMPSKAARHFIVTTNYDVLIERAFEKAKRPLCVITQNMRDPENGATKVNLVLPDGKHDQESAKDFILDGPRFPEGTTYLFKMHGSSHHDPREGGDDLIVTENDYVDFLVNTGGTVTPNFPPASLHAAFMSKRFLFLGYSLEDWNFRAFLRLLSLRNALSKANQFRHFAVQRSPSELDVELWKQRNVNVYDGDLLDFCTSLENAWP